MADFDTELALLEREGTRLGQKYICVGEEVVAILRAQMSGSSAARRLLGAAAVMAGYFRVLLDEMPGVDGASLVEMLITQCAPHAKPEELAKLRAEVLTRLAQGPDVPFRAEVAS